MQQNSARVGQCDMPLAPFRRCLFSVSSASSISWCCRKRSFCCWTPKHGVPEIEDRDGEHDQEQHQERHPVDADDAKGLLGRLLLRGGNLLDRLAQWLKIQEERADKQAGKQDQKNRADEPPLELPPEISTLLRRHIGISADERKVCCWRTMKYTATATRMAAIKRATTISRGSTVLPQISERGNTSALLSSNSSLNLFGAKAPLAFQPR